MNVGDRVYIINLKTTGVIVRIDPKFDNIVYVVDDDSGDEWEAFKGELKPLPSPTERKK